MMALRDGCIAMVRPSKKQKTASKSLYKRIRNLGAFVLSLCTHSFLPTQSALMQQGELRSSHHLLPRTRVFNKIPRAAGSGKQG